MVFRLAACALLAAAGTAAPVIEILDHHSGEHATNVGPREAGKSRVNGPTPATATLIKAGQTIVDYSPSYTSMYYLYEAYAALTSPPFFATFGTLTIAVSPISGNPNVFVGIGQQGANGNLWNASSVEGIDYIQISQNDTALLSNCAQYWTVPNFPCLIYIRVTGGPQQSTNPAGPGTRSTNYSISVSDSVSGNQLISDVPYIGQVVPGGASQGFTYTLTTVPQVVSFTVTPLVGFGSRSTPILAVSILSANPDYQNSSVTCAVGNSGLSGREVVTLSPSSVGCWCAAAPCTYYLSITPRSDLTFVQQYALTASTAAAPNITLVDGEPTSYDGASAAAGTAPTPLFVFNSVWDVNTARAVRIIQTPIVGSVQLFATLDGSIPTNNNYQYSATRISGQNELVIRISDPQVATYCAAALANNNITCQVLIAAVTVTQRSSFTIEARQSAVFRLSPSVPVNDYVNPGRTTYYFMEDVNFGGTFEVTLTPLSNQFVDIFVGSDAYPGMQYPTPNVTGSYCKTTQASTSQAGYIAIPPTDPCFCNTTSAKTCNYYIGVAARFNASADYIIMGKYQGGFQLLQLNVPFTDALPNGLIPPAYNGYVLLYPEGFNRTIGTPADSVTINVDTQPGAGYILLGANICLIGTNGTCNFTTPSANAVFDYTSQVYSSDTNGQIVVQAVDPAFRNKCLALLPSANYNASCAVQFWMRADPSLPGPNPSLFTVTPFAGARQLIDGQVASGAALGGNYAYFRYTVVDLTRPLKITVAALSGNPDLFVGLGFWPNTSAFTFVSGTPGTEVIQITWDSTLVQNTIRQNGLSTPFDVNIAVEGLDGPITFNIEATSNGIVPLSLGRTVAGVAGPLGFTYYFYQQPFNVSRQLGFRLDFVATAGATPIVMANGPSNNGPYGYPLIPRCANAVCDGTSFTNYQAISTGSGQSINSLEIDPSIAVNGTWIIGVYANPLTTFQLTLTNLQGIQQLANGIPTFASTTFNSYTYFSFSWLGSFDYLEFVAVSQVGITSLDLYASIDITNRRPNATQLTGGRSGVFGSVITPRGATRNVLVLNSTSFSNTSNTQGTSCNVNRCTVYVSVVQGNPRYNLQNTSFTLTATVKSNGASYTILSPGVPVYDFLPSNSVAYYTAYLPVGFNTSLLPVSINLSPVRPDVNLYANFIGTPGPGNSTYNSSTAGGVDYLYIPRRDINAAAVNQSGVYIYIAVRTTTLSPADSTAAYYITLTDGDANVVTQLVPGVPATNRVPAFSNAYYYFTMTSPGADQTGDLTFSLTSNGGDASLYLNQWSNTGNNSLYRPGPFDNCANSTNDDGDWIIIPAVAARPGPQPPPFQPSQPGYAPQCRCPSFPCNLIMTVACPTAQSCEFTLTGTYGDATPLFLAEGTASNLPIQSGKIVYYSIDTRVPVANKRNITISAQMVSGGQYLYLWATNKFTPGLSDPKMLPNPQFSDTYFPVWSSNPFDANGNPTGQLTASPTLTITFADSPSDATGSYNLTTNPIITVAVTSDPRPWQQVPGNPVNSRFTWFSDGGDAQQLSLGVSSPLQFLSGPPAGTSGVVGSTRRFSIFLADPSKDLVVSVTPQGSGRLALAMDPTDPTIGCGYSGAAVVCGGLWTTAGQTERNANTLTISAANPCGNAQGACASNSTAYRRGSYYIAVVALTDVQFIITASQAGTVNLLTESTPVTSYANNFEQPLFQFFTQPQRQANPFPVAFYVTATDAPLTVYINFCTSTQGSGPQGCPPGNQLPGPGNPSSSQQSFNIAAQATTIVTLRSGSGPAFCSPGLGNFCSYYVTVWTTGDCDPGKGCVGTFTLMGTMQNGADPVLLGFNQVANQVTSLSSTMPALGQLYAIGLDPTSGPSDIVMALDACSGYPALYGCNPNPDPQGSCSNNFKPGPGNFNHFAYPAANQGRDFLAMPQVSGANQVFVQMLADASNPTAQPTFNMLLSVRTGYYLHPGVNFGQYGGIALTQVSNTSDIQVSWQPAVIRDSQFNVIGPAVGVVYTVYVAFDGFSYVNSASIPGSACGLANWVATPGVQAATYTTNSTSIEVVNLAATTYYEVNVVASCDASCFAASLPPQMYGEMTTNMRALRVENGRVLQTQPYNTPAQAAPFRATNFTSAANNQPAAAPAAPSNIPAIAGGAGGGVAFCCCLGIVIFLCRRRRSAIPKADIKADDRAKRVAQLGLGAAAPAVPGASSAAADISTARAERATFEPVAGGGGNVAGWK